MEIARAERAGREAAAEAVDAQQAQLQGLGAGFGAVAPSGGGTSRSSLSFERGGRSDDRAEPLGGAAEPEAEPAVPSKVIDHR